MAQTRTPIASLESPAKVASEQEPLIQEEEEEQVEEEDEHERPNKRQKLNMDKKNKRLITAANSKLGKVDLTVLLTQPDAWSTLPLTTRQHLCSLLPAPSDDSPHDPEVNPLGSKFGAIIAEELQVWQDELKDGYETAKWRNEAMEAGRERAEGKYDEWKEAAREEQWGRVEDEENEVPAKGETELNGTVDGEESEAGSEIVVSKANIKVKRAAAS